MIKPDLQFEQEAWMQGKSVVVGVDEVGRGAWAGPVVAAAVQFAPESVCFGESAHGGDQSVVLPQLLRDSKKLSPRQRVQLYSEIESIAIQSAFGLVEVEEINQMGIGQANFLAMSRALNQLSPPPDFILIDGYNHPEIDASKQLSIVKGDSVAASIAAASVIAKVYRDRLMLDLAKHYPEYRFDLHKGYGTAVHQQAIKTHGLSPIHRKNFKLKFLTQ